MKISITLTAVLCAVCDLSAVAGQETDDADFVKILSEIDRDAINPSKEDLSENRREWLRKTSELPQQLVGRVWARLRKNNR